MIGYNEEELDYLKKNKLTLPNDLVEGADYDGLLDD